MSRSDKQGGGAADLAERALAFVETPDGKRFVALRDELRQAGRGELLAAVCAAFAAVAIGPAAAAAWSEAGETYLLIGDIAAGRRALERALLTDPLDERARVALASYLVGVGHAASAVEVVEAELAALAAAPGASPARAGRAHARAAEIWHTHLGRLDKALAHYQTAWQLEPQRTDHLAHARAIYASLGEEAMVRRLWQTELEVLGKDGPPAPRAAAHAELGRLLAAAGERRAALAHVEAAVALEPTVDARRAALAELLTSLAADGDAAAGARAAEVFVALGQARLAAGDTDGGVAFLRRAVGADPMAAAPFRALIDALTELGHAAELERLLRGRGQLITQAADRAELLRRRVALYQAPSEGGDRAVLIATLEELAPLEPPRGPASMRLRALYREGQRWQALAALMERELETLDDDPAAQVVELLELATVVREHVGDKDRAAGLLQRVLALAPLHEEALARYTDHFRERRDWRGLADLLEFALESARDAGATPAEQIQRLEEIAQLAELRLGDIPRAQSAWSRIAALEPGGTKAADAGRRLEARARMWDQLVTSLEAEASDALDGQARVATLHRMAQTFRERQLEPRRAIALYEEILRISPDDDAALRALAETYERDSNELGVASALRRQLEVEERRHAAAGLQPTAWPPGKRAERISVLRRLLGLYETRLADLDGIVWAGRAILEVLPGDRDALERMERALEKAGDDRLPQVLEYHAAAAGSPGERGKLLRRLARLTPPDDEALALERWEQVLRTLPADLEALEVVADMFERSGRYAEAASALERLEAARAPAVAGAPDAPLRARDFERHARLAGEHLADPVRAIASWRRVLSLLPRSRDALASLAALHEGRREWRELADIQAQQIALHAEVEPGRAAAVALARARLLEEHLGAPVDAMRQLERLIADLDPTQLEAHQSLRRLHAARGEYDAAVRIAERELYLLAEPAAKVERGLEIGRICRERLGDGARALQAFERVLAIEPEHEEALVAAAELHAELGHPRDVARLFEARLRSASGQALRASERRELIRSLAEVHAEQLSDPATAFRWLSIAHATTRDGQAEAGTLDDMRQLARRFALWAELAAALEQERAALLARGAGGAPSEPARYVALTRELAGIAEHGQQDVRRALTLLVEALRVSPRDGEVFAEIERLAAAARPSAGPRSGAVVAASEADRVRLAVLCDAFDVAIAAALPGERVELYLRRARVLEDEAGDVRGATADVLAAFSWAPEAEEPRAALAQLAERTRAWHELVAVESALVERASTDAQRLAALRRKAAVIEDKLKDAPRAFRTHLVAFLVAPGDADTSAHLWRLARVIGKYGEGDGSPRPEPPVAAVQNERAIAEATAAARRKVAGVARPPQPLRPTTEELTDGDLGRERHDQTVGDSTMPLDLSELERADRGRAAPRGDATMELGDDDLSSARVPAPGAPRRPPPAPPPRSPTTTATTTLAAGRPGLPPISRPPAPPAPPRKAQATVRRVPPPTLPSGPFATPWEEFAHAWELPTASSDVATRLRGLFRAAEIWETGARDLARAFDTLARGFVMARKAGVSDGDVRARLHRLANEHGAWDRLAELYEAMAEQAESGAHASTLLLDVAEIRLRQQRTRDAEAVLRRILGMTPDNRDVRGRLEELYRKDGRWVELAASLEERTDPRLGEAAPVAERPALLRQLAELYTARLERPHDAIDALERLRTICPDEPGLGERLAELYGSIGRWSKAVDALARVAEHTEAPEQAAAALRRIAYIYERELELPERALDAYVGLVALASDDAEAWAALDRLYTTYARWGDLIDVLRRRANLATTPEARAALWARRAQVLLDWDNNAEEAAASLRHARTLVPGDPDLAEQLVTALLRCGRDREAAGVLEGRIAALREHGAERARGELAALYVRLASIRRDSQQDGAGARDAVAAALELVPDHPTALAAASQLASPEVDPRAFVDTQLAAADGATDDDARVGHLMTAAEALRDRCGDPDGARALMQRVLELRPLHMEATWALAALVERGGDPADAARVLERRLEDKQVGAAERVRVLTQLAALARAADLAPVAERRLLEAIAAAEHTASPRAAQLAPVLALADLYRDAGRLAELETTLRDALGDPGDPNAPAPTLAPPTPEAAAIIVELHRRLADAQERLGRDDDAYQTLLAADRLHRGHLVIKLALGENRYRARRWREAALHLSPLATHADAPRYASDVAQGLYHAALAEIRSLRPDKAPPLYARALELRPNFGPALQASAELAMEQGDHARAAELLTRQATATDDPVERLRLFEALGDLAVTVLHDEARARVCYEAAVAAARPIEARHVPLLEKLLERHDLAGDHLGAGRVAELMAAFAPTAPARASRYLRAALDYVAGDDTVRARAAVARALENEPGDLDAADLASDLAIEAGDHAAAVELLARCLGGKSARSGRATRPPTLPSIPAITGPAPGNARATGSLPTVTTPSPVDSAAQRTVRARLWHRLGVARLARGDARQASAAFESAIEVGPDSPGAIEAHRALARLLVPDDGARGPRPPALAEHLRAIAAASGAVADVVAWADELRRAGDDDGARLALDVAVALGHGLDVHQIAFVQNHGLAALADDGAYRTALAPEVRAELVDGPEAAAERTLAAVLGQLADVAGLIWPDTADALARAGLAGATRIAATSVAPAVAMFPRVAGALGTAASLFQHASALGDEARVLCAGTPIVVLGPDLLAETGDAGARRAAMTRAAELVRPERLLAAGLTDADGARLVTAVARLFGPASLRAAASRTVRDEEVQRAYDDVVRSALPVRVRTRLEQLLASATLDELDLGRYRAACQRAADRAAILLAPDVAAAMAAVRRRGGELGHLVRLVATPSFRTARAALGLGLRA